MQLTEERAQATKTRRLIQWHNAAVDRLVAIRTNRDLTRHERSACASILEAEIARAYRVLCHKRDVVMVVDY